MSGSKPRKKTLDNTTNLYIHILIRFDQMNEGIKDVHLSPQGVISENFLTTHIKTTQVLRQVQLEVIYQT